jgi:hypothetical protein
LQARARPSGIDEVEIICRVGGEAAQHSMKFVDHVVDDRLRVGEFVQGKIERWF